MRKVYGMGDRNIDKRASSSDTELVGAMRKLTNLLGPRLKKDKISLFVLAKDDYIDVYAVWLKDGRWLGAVRVFVNGEIDTSFSYSSDDLIRCTNYKHPGRYMLIREEKVEDWCKRYAIWAISSISSVYPFSNVFYDLEHGSLRVVVDGSSKVISKPIVMLDKTSPIIFAKELRNLNVAFHTKEYHYAGRCWSDFSDYPVTLMGLGLNIKYNRGNWGIAVHKSNSDSLLYISGSFEPSGSAYLHYTRDDFQVPGTEYYVQCSNDLSKEVALSRIRIEHSGDTDVDKILSELTDAFLISMAEFAWNLVQSLTPAGERPFSFYWNGAYDLMRIAAWDEDSSKLVSQSYFFSSHKFVYEDLSDQQIRSLLVPKPVTSVDNNKNMSTDKFMSFLKDYHCVE